MKLDPRTKLPVLAKTKVTSWRKVRAELEKLAYIKVVTER